MSAINSFIQFTLLNHFIQISSLLLKCLQRVSKRFSERLCTAERSWREAQRLAESAGGSVRGLTPKIIEKNDSDLFFEWTATLVGFSPGVEREEGEEEGGRRAGSGGKTLK